MVSAGVGLQMHFGTDHDHVADYNPLIGPMGLSEWLVSVVSSEMSPVVRGHINLYPLEQIEAANGGAWLWWSNRVTSTEEQMALLRGHYPNAFRIQLNHPLDTGLGESAKWSPGKIGNAEKWSVDFDTIEILNAGRYDKYLPFYLDLFGRGILSAPTGTSDSHSHTGGQVGLSATFFGMGTNVVADYSDEILREAIDARHTIVTRGPFLDMSIAPGSVISTADTLEVKALTPSWIQVDRLQLWKDGEVVTTVEGNEATFELAPEADSYYVVMAEGDSAMGGVWGGQTPWAMSSPILFDVGGDGWTPPLAPLEMD